MKTIFSILLAVVLISCGPPSNESIPVNLTGIVNYGNGVYGFTNDDFPQTLSVFLRNNPDLEATAISGDGLGYYGKNTYYIVTFRERNTK